MLSNLSEEVRECLEHAEDCARQAAAQTDPKLKQDFLVMERRWRFLARSYGLTLTGQNTEVETQPLSKDPSPQP
jgi:hypothetical protein